MITTRQAEVFNFVRAWFEHKQYPPTLKNIGDGLGLTSGAIQSHLLALQKKGFVSWNANESRTLTITGDPYGPTES